MPDVSGVEPIRYERYYIRREPDIEERVQKKGGTYEYERKEKISGLESAKEKKQISIEEFNEMKSRAGDAIIRDSYLLNLEPSISIKVYHGKYEGLVRAEVEFDSAELATEFSPLPWMGREITDTLLGRDAKLLDLGEEEFRMELENLAK